MRPEQSGLYSARFVQGSAGRRAHKLDRESGVGRPVGMAVAVLIGSSAMKAQSDRHGSMNAGQSAPSSLTR